VAEATAATLNARELEINTFIFALLETDSSGCGNSPAEPLTYSNSPAMQVRPSQQRLFERAQLLPKDLDGLVPWL
jgi:hypothetical protein